MKTTRQPSATRAGAVGRAQAYLESGAFESDLGRRVAYKTESQKLPDSLGQLNSYLTDELAPSFERLGFTTRIYPNPQPGQGPVLLATRIEDEKLPTVLGYGHGDVVRGLEEQWTRGKGPWVVAREGDRLYGRGTTDNKGQHTINMAALEAVRAERGGALGFNAKFMIETAEETGSKGLAELVAAHKADFAADVMIASDGPRVSADRPTLTLGCRGALNFDLVCELREGAHHSGNWGGLIANPGLILANALASIVGPSGELLVPALRAPAMSEAVKGCLADVVVDGGETGPDVDAWWGEPGLSPAERVFGSNVFHVLAFTTGTPGRPVNAIPPKAVANCQLRFVAGTDAAGIVPALQRHLDAKGFAAVKVLPPPASNDGRFSATRTEPDHPWVQFATRSLQRSANAKPAIIPQMGGSICNDVFTDILGIPTVWIPHSYPSCSAHAPDEHILLSSVRSALSLMAGLYWDIGEARDADDALIVRMRR
ncbi:MAG TPA: M20 family metallopeptidase [Hyphomicrobiaceae bacterium]|nr:M20 family metallopeptidase [Hyphomicrobiaceae bacterium]